MGKGRLANIVRGSFLVGFFGLVGWQFAAPIKVETVHDFEREGRAYSVIRKSRGPLTIDAPRYYFSPDTVVINGEVVRPISMISDNEDTITVRGESYFINRVKQE